MGPNPQCERAADIVLGLIHAKEMMTFNSAQCTDQSLWELPIGTAI